MIWASIYLKDEGSGLVFRCQNATIGAGREDYLPSGERAVPEPFRRQALVFKHALLIRRLEWLNRRRHPNCRSGLRA